ncbi:Low temperature viability protein [Choiromyces venosus 120613-1]|uniref:Low temperature viability protein n=1 Tax=Choiromyces venosus 120613-1 TaxID=1336337 RepID=A0A3N4K8K1_9PEZI|nr:Low temperature viability protein [Choiromyces venosus 120613-1]
MPTKKWIDKKTATNYQLRYRAQTDPLIHDDQASDLVFTQVAAPNSTPSTTASSSSSSKIKTASTFSQELSLSPSSLRENEGEAAMHGVYYDDTEYDYMQHMRDINDSQVYFVDAQDGKNKKKEKMKLEEALKLPQEVLPSGAEVKRTYQDMQDVPDALSGFQPDMDPRLREVLEALEDEAYVDDDEDVFGELAKGGEVSLGEFEEEEDGWESDVTEKAPPPNNSHPPHGGKEEEEEEDWQKAFKSFKKDQKKGKVTFDNDSLADTMSFGGTMSVSNRSLRRKKKAGTESSGYSMSSSALFRTEGLTLLDDRFDKIEEEYAKDDEDEEEDMRSNSGVALPETRHDLDSVLDEFLEGYSVGKKGRVRRGKYGSGIEQLDEIRRGLGGARITSS